ncbi:hypothetical protein RGUI_2421 [Rhodovulum sp. P5]|uniref:hypothetical protein n=1 Tax=Rhodovulum sp. P5 TaxID=1564506 RepID=UPI0009C24FD9|nr:hypothetical protein [Rhodovulum sp. P5]ARE40562.1 hypothetical protein RGUI_2421 [Rhodovulum sp. P5]
MSRRSTPQQKIDDKAFPVRVRVEVPENGLGRMLNDMHLWLETHVGRGDYAWHSGGRVSLSDTVALYFRDPAAGTALLAAFPLVLADGTLLETYTSPMLPLGHHEENITVCNLYSQTNAQEAMRQLFDIRPELDRLGNLQEQSAIYPDQLAPIVRTTDDGRELAMARWGMPTPPKYLEGKKTDRGVTNIRNTRSPHWLRRRMTSIRRMAKRRTPFRISHLPVQPTPGWPRCTPTRCR